MDMEVYVNEVKINATGFQEQRINDPKTGKRLYQISFDFKVRSGEDYHHITTLLYKERFDVKVPERNLEFRGSIVNYSTSITNLYQENKVGDFSLALMEINHEA